MNNKASKTMVTCLLTFVIGFFAAGALGSGEVIATPGVVLEGLTTELQIQCRVGREADNVNSLFLMQIEKMVNGRQTPIATIHTGQQPTLEGASIYQGRATVSGAINANNLATSHLTVTIHTPSQADTGSYLCVITAFDASGLILQLTSSVLVNSTAASSVQDLHDALSQVIHDLAALKNGQGAGCGCTSLEAKAARLEADNVELRARVLALESGVRLPVNESFIFNVHPQVNPIKPLGFVAVGNAGSVNYNTLIYSINGSYDTQEHEFVAPVAGFYMFHAFDSQPRNPQMAIVVNDRTLAYSGKANAEGPTQHPGDPPRYTSLSVSGLVHLDVGDRVQVKYVSETQSFGASFAGTLVSANDV